jgi:hypothetical protein
MGQQRLIKLYGRHVKHTDNIANPVAAAFSGLIIDLCYDLIKIII